MRLRNIPHADDVILAHAAAIKNETEQKGNWHTLFGNNHPIHIEIGMGKGQFLLTLAKKYQRSTTSGLSATPVFFCALLKSSTPRSTKD